jgi:membrane associated rhomboid family serine protease
MPDFQSPPGQPPSQPHFDVNQAFSTPAPAEPAAMFCKNHPKRPTRITCRRCGQPICADCMIPAAVGYQCPQCVKAHTKQTRINEGPYGGAISSNPMMTSVIIVGINVAVFVLIAATGGPTSFFTSLLGLMPSGMCVIEGTNSWYPNVPDPQVCASIADATWMPGVAEGAIWQPFTSIFTHVSALHLLTNSVSLIFIGPPVERVVGRARFLALYLVAGLFGSAFVMWLSGAQSLSYGASGSIFGLLGALLIISLKLRYDIKQLIFWIGLNVVITFTGSNISWQAHLGGLIGGAIATVALLYAPSGPRRNLIQWTALGMLAAICLVAISLRAFALG